MKKLKRNKKRQFSKTLLIQESILVWITTLSCLGFGYMCILKGYLGTLPWISSIIASVYAAYAVSQACYYKKSTKENTKDGIVYETSIIEQKNEQDVFSSSEFNNNYDSSLDLFGPM